jgi:uncharacterized membrane protein YhaH (DUF805 family)
MNFSYLFTSLDGRINRKPYWLAALLLLVVSLVSQLLVYAISTMQIMLIFGLIFMWPSFALAVKRAHDRNRPTWLVGIFFGILLLTTLMQIAGIHETPAGEQTAAFAAVSIIFMVFAIYAFVDWGLLRGTKGPNQYGPDPLEQ